MKNLKKRKLLFYLVSTLLLYTLIRCSQTGQNTGSSCTPNVIDNGLSLNVTSLGSNTYSFELCASSVPVNAVYSVYGATSVDDLSNGFNVNAAIRTPSHISDANYAGSVFQITFNSNDGAFAIFQDRNSGVTYQLDNTMSPMVSPHALPGK